MNARTEPPPPHRRLASGRGNLATPPGLDLRPGKPTNQSVNQFQWLFLSELVLHYTKSGPLADANVYRFSSKEYLPNSGLVYYLYRFYDANLQRWPNRDPLNDPGFLSAMYDVAWHAKTFIPFELFEDPNLYAIIENNPESNLDPLGLAMVPRLRPPPWPRRPPQPPPPPNWPTIIIITNNDAVPQFCSPPNEPGSEKGYRTPGIQPSHLPRLPPISWPTPPNSSHTNI